MSFCVHSSNHVPPPIPSLDMAHQRGICARIITCHTILYNLVIATSFSKSSFYFNLNQISAKYFFAQNTYKSFLIWSKFCWATNHGRQTRWNFLVAKIFVTFSLHLASSTISYICLYLPHTEPYITKEIDALEANRYMVVWNFNNNQGWLFILRDKCNGSHLNTWTSWKFLIGSFLKKNRL